MAMNSPTVPDNIAPVSSGTGASSTADVSPPPARWQTFLKQEGQWLFVIVPYIFAWGLPFAWAGYRWTTPSYILFFQSFVPFLTLLVTWTQRDKIVRAWNRMGSRTVRKSGLRGSPLVLVIGCLMLAFAHLVQIKGIAVGGLLLIGWGVVYSVFGARVLQAAWIAVIFSLLSIPIPDSIADAVQKTANALTLHGAVPIFKKLGRPVQYGTNKLGFVNNGYIADYNGTEGAAGVIATALVIVLCYALARRFSSVRTTLLLCWTVILGVAFNFCRVLAAGILGSSSERIGNLLSHNEIVVFAIGVLTLASALLVDHLSNLLLRRLLSRGRVTSGPGLAMGVEKLGRAGETMVAPLEHGVRQAGTLWKRSERGIESAFRMIPSPRFNPFALLGTAWKRSEQTIEKGFKLVFGRKKKRRRR